jgi:ribosomal protein L12E/L44/L45/RPP1/RPP2
MSVSDLNNSPIEFDIDGKVYKVKKLSVLDIFSQVETKIKEDYLKSVTDMSKILPDKDRPDFLRSAIKEIPSGRKLEDMVNEKINTVAGGIDILNTILNKCQQVSIDEVMSMVAKESNSTTVSSIMSYALGQGKEEAKEVGDTKQKK